MRKSPKVGQLSELPFNSFTHSPTFLRLLRLLAGQSSRLSFSPFRMLGAFLTTICFSLSAIFANRSIRAVGLTRANLGRLLFALLVLGLYAHTFGQGRIVLPIVACSPLVVIPLPSAAIFPAESHH